MSSPDSSSGVLVLGGGPAGMAAAFELSRAGKRVTVVEREENVGGLAKTLVIHRPEGTYRTDIGPHRFFSKNRYLYEMIEDLLGERWIAVPRHTRFYVNEKFYFYPVRLRNVIGQLGFIQSFRVVRDFLYEKVRSVLKPRKIASFGDYAISNFGRTLAEFNMINYTEKIWGLPVDQISVDWASQRIAGLSPWATLKKMIWKQGGPKTLVDSFHYPDHGSGLIYERMRERVESAGGIVLTRTEPTALEWKDHRITRVFLKNEEGVKTFEPEAVVSSIPMTHAALLFAPQAPAHVMEAANSLKFRAQVYLFLTVDRDHVTHDNWIYFPNKEIPFGRIAEMKNFSSRMVPDGKTSLFIEFFCFEGDDIWRKSADDLFHLAIQWLEKLKFLKREEVLSFHHFRQPHVYPLYDLTYSDRVSEVITWMDTFENFHAIGRPGRFRYTNQDHSLEMGILAAKNVLAGRRIHDIDAVGSDSESFEKGYVPHERKP
ncbi:hypothetical protein A3J91_04910 [Candidatus Peribacteria bacterium RIFOXYC2_FULL_58_10]|nr:MAG: hypothetical protein A3J91_04910 [Candidatus Peribacteria bacterium RIFOXYC2_FULL_58_10]